LFPLLATFFKVLPLPHPCFKPIAVVASSSNQVSAFLNRNALQWQFNNNNTK